MQPEITLATIAEYYRLGIEAGLLKPEEAQEWATSLLRRLDDPPYEIIEVSWGKGLATTIDNLREVKGARDSQTAGGWLLGYLREHFPDDDEGLVRAARQAMQIARSAGLGDDVYYGFDSIDDGIFLAMSGTYGSVEDSRKDLLDVLKDYPLPRLGNET